jgi:hypothetical protein
MKMSFMAIIFIVAIIFLRSGYLELFNATLSNNNATQ